MIEVSFTEMFLFAWAVIATGYAFKNKADKDVTVQMLRLFVENEDARAEMLNSYEQFKKRNSA